MIPPHLNRTIKIFFVVPSKFYLLHFSFVHFLCRNISLSLSLHRYSLSLSLPFILSSSLSGYFSLSVFLFRTERQLSLSYVDDDDDDDVEAGKHTFSFCHTSASPNFYEPSSRKSSFVSLRAFIWFPKAFIRFPESLRLVPSD